MPMVSLTNLLPSLARLSLQQPRATSGRPGRSRTLWFDDAQRAEEPTQTLVKTCLGCVAVSRLAVRAGGKVEGVVFVEELFVRDESRKQGIGRCLLTHAMKMEDHSIFTKAALVVRVHAAQQAAALRLYERLGFLRVRKRALRDFGTGEDAEVDPEDGVEAYMEAPINLDACELQEPDAEGRVFVQGTSVFVDAAPVQPAVFMAAYPAVVDLADQLHSAADGDGGNVQEILEAANVGVYGAYVLQ